MFKQYITLFSFLLLSVVAAHPAQAQRNFRPGYIVRPAGDSLRGEVDVRGQQRMGLLCVFRANAGAATTQYTPTELKAYGLQGGARYEACQLPGGLTTAPGGAALSSSPTTLFMQQLVQGKAKLYSYVDEGGNSRYFFRTTDGPVAEVVQIIQNVTVNDVLVQQKSYPFRQVLSKAFIDCPVVQPMLIKAELKESQLVAIFNRYNSCAPGQASTVATARKTKVHFGLVAGVQSATTTLDDEGKVDLKSGTRPVFGAGLLLNPASFNERLALRIELLYQKQLYEGQYQRNNGVVTNLSSSRNAQIALQTVRVPLMLRYTLPNGMVRPYVQVGAEVSTLLDSHQALIVETNQKLGGVGTTTTSREIETRNFGFGATGALGVLIPAGPGSLQLEARYNQLDSSSRAANQLTGAQTIYFLLGYNLGR
ncbi:outer membrane beta-barrel protein [Hymenobacter ruber]